MSGGGTQKNIRKALGAIKDSTRVGLAKVNSDYKVRILYPIWNVWQFWCLSCSTLEFIENLMRFTISLYFLML